MAIAVPPTRPIHQGRAIWCNDNRSQLKTSHQSAATPHVMRVSPSAADTSSGKKGMGSAFDTGALKSSVVIALIKYKSDTGIKASATPYDNAPHPKLNFVHRC